MDMGHFDALARALSTARNRRSSLAVLLALPVTGGLLGILTPDDAKSAGRRKRRKKRHKHGKGRHRPERRKRRRKPTCTSDLIAFTCASAPCGSSDGCGGTCPCPGGQTCCGGTCSECDCGQTRLSNGTCVTPCTDNDQCCAECINWQDDPMIRYCGTGAEPLSCGTDGDAACPQGMFCTQAGFCTPACAEESGAG